MTDAELINRLIAEASAAPDWRSGSTLPGHLPLFNHWGPVSYLTPAGEVVRNDDEGGPLQPADPAERDFALARAADLYPELAHLKPPRPPTATTCDQCRGQGKVVLSQGTLAPWQEQQNARSFLYCPGCNSLGWTESCSEK